jgi:hypothetical protein
MSVEHKKCLRGHVLPSGQLQLPMEICKAVGLEHGGAVLIELDGRDIRIRTVADGVARAREISRRLLAGNPNASVDDFLAFRKREWDDA